ncbi:hypothetical protein MTBUT4_110001 [Magnetospirillum sp. UT-4]|nr:hypothetical protein MTBUT4_110001 [Magnetospirillum sp. UT-4]
MLLICNGYTGNLNALLPSLRERGLMAEKQKGA